MLGPRQPRESQYTAVANADIRYSSVQTEKCSRDAGELTIFHDEDLNGQTELGGYAASE